VVLRRARPSSGHLTTAAYQMAVGGGALALLGLALGEAGRLPEQVTPGAAGAFLYLLVVGSLVGFVAFNWLLGHVPAAQVGTYAYVNPLVAVLVGCLLDHEEVTGWMIAGIAIILGGVALVRHRDAGTATSTRPAALSEATGAESPPLAWQGEQP
jgi:drug/metabolite transporter (DMT)-like permease